MKCRGGGITLHDHESVEEVKKCYGLLPTVVARPPAPVVSSAGYVVPRPAGLATVPQLDYVADLGGDVSTAALMPWKACSRYIDQLKARRPVTEPATAREESKVPIPLLDMVPDGYFAVRADESEPYVFLRVKRPKSGRLKGCTKVQTQHGPNLSPEKFVVWPSGKVSVYEHTIQDSLLLLICDYRGSAMAYAQKIGRCCRCNLELTDQRSRHYGIGPDCEQVWPWVIEYVDEREALKAGGV